MALIKEREAVRAEKNWAQADAMRDQYIGRWYLHKRYNNWNSMVFS